MIGSSSLPHGVPLCTCGYLEGAAPAAVGRTARGIDKEEQAEQLLDIDTHHRLYFRYGSTRLVVIS